MTIEIYGGPSPNVIKVLVACEELGLVYTRTPLDILKGEQFTPEFLAISPNNRIPAIVDHDPRDRRGPLPVFESGAILIYLAEREGKLLPTEPRQRAAREVTAARSRAAAARTSVRKAWAVRPRRPMILPMSPGATCSRWKVPSKSSTTPA